MDTADGIETVTSVADIYTRVTGHIVEALEEHSSRGLPWHNAGGLPANAATGRPYRGINTLALWAASAVAGYESASWGTFSQWQRLGRSVRRGQKASTVVFWRSFDAGGEAGEDAGEDRPVRFVARGYPVFNADQIAEPPELATPEPADRYAPAEGLVSRLGPDLRHGGGDAFYSPAGDYIQMPFPDHYRDRSAYYATLTHELTHWTGAAARLDRNLSQRFGSAAYAMEELVAELGSAFLCALLGLESQPRADHARYIDSWLGVLRHDTRAVFTAASKAQAAVDWMCPQQDPEQPSV
jgi:antirestriction protein ArdC